MCQSPVRGIPHLTICLAEHAEARCYLGVMVTLAYPSPCKCQGKGAAKSFERSFAVPGYVNAETANSHWPRITHVGKRIVFGLRPPVNAVHSSRVSWRSLVPYLALNFPVGPRPISLGSTSIALQTWDTSHCAGSMYI